MTFTSETVCCHRPQSNPFQNHRLEDSKTMIIQHQQQQQQQLLPPVARHQYQKFSTTNNAVDPVYLEDDEVFYNLFVKESSEQDYKQQQQPKVNQQLVGQQRHLLLSWMLKVCEHEYCEDDIFSLATMILDKFLLAKQPIISAAPASCSRRRRIRIKKVRKKPFMSTIYADEEAQQQQIESFYCNEYDSSNNNIMSSADCVSAEKQLQQDNEEEDEDEEEIVDYDVRDGELRQRQLYLFAACSLLLASKLRQTPRLCVQILIEFSKLELPIELTRDEILDCELLILSSLKWDLGSLVTPNDFLALILRKCRPLLDRNDAGQLELFQFATNRFHPKRDRLYSGHVETTTTTIATTTTTIIRPASALVALVPMETPSALITPNSTPDEMIAAEQRRSADSMSLPSPSPSPQTTTTTTTRCDEFKVKRHTQTLLELCLMDSQLSQYSPSILAMASMSVAINGLSSNWDDESPHKGQPTANKNNNNNNCARLNEILRQVHEATHKVNELKLMIDVAYQIEKYVQKLLNSTRND